MKHNKIEHIKTSINIDGADCAINYDKEVVAFNGRKRIEINASLNYKTPIHRLPITAIHFVYTPPKDSFVLDKDLIPTIISAKKEIAHLIAQKI